MLLTLGPVQTSTHHGVELNRPLAAKPSRDLRFIKLLTIIPRALMGSESIAHEAEGRMGY